MRLWIGPDNEMVDLDLVDLPHSFYVAENPDRFGLAPGIVKAHMEKAFSSDGDFDFDYDTVIVMAEMNGWVRVSRDATSSGQAAVSASCEKDAQRAIIFLSGIAPGFTGADVEIERLVGSRVERTFASLSPDDTIRFMKHGVLKNAHRFASEVGDPDLLEALPGQTFAMSP